MRKTTTRTYSVKVENADAIEALSTDVGWSQSRIMDTAATMFLASAVPAMLRQAAALYGPSNGTKSAESSAEPNAGGQ